LRQQWFSDCGKNRSGIAARIVQTAGSMGPGEH
jgi:hypothetical protein